MKILVLNWRDPKHPLAGGAELSLYNQVKRWTYENEVIWFSSGFKRAKKNDILEGVKIIRRGSHYTVHLYAFYYILTKKIKGFDIVLDAFHFIPFFTPFYIKKTPIIAVINEIAGKLWFSNLFYPAAFIGYYLEPYFLKVYKNKVFMTFSKSTEEELVKNQIPKKNITVVNHGVDKGEVSDEITKEKKPTILYLNRIALDKGIINFLKIVKIILSKNQNVQVWIAGKEEKKGMLADLISEYCPEVKHNIKYFGYISNAEKYKLYKKTWLFIHTSQKEGWGINVIEAASLGTPAVGFDVEGLRDSIINNRTGILTNPNPSDMAKTILELIDNKKRIESMGKKAYTWGTGFSWDKSSEEAWKVVENVINRYEK